MTSTQFKSIRRKKKLKQREFADLLGIGQWDVSRIETGKKPVPKCVVKLIECWKEKDRRK